ncbi:hypothetical protein WR25_09202 [Diploscapter pachys]|uniref:Ig-like domain-containing protein n=1 Tax=Diploscapter pachys TaxID=2018661 RepID=A0A2A2LZ26_9BILA|nr:hypothetical protein WR25_09202 [Diploscapter pachys]
MTQTPRALHFFGHKMDGQRKSQEGKGGFLTATGESEETDADLDKSGNPIANVRSNEIGNEENPVEISSGAMDYDTNTIIIRAGKKLLISCLYTKDDIGDLSDLQWTKEGGHIIDGESSPSAFTIGMIEQRTEHKKKNLHFTSIHQRDKGAYECTARTQGGRTLKNTVNVVVLDEIQWKDSETTVGGLIGEPLTIDCGVVDGGPDEIIKITDENGEPLNDSTFTLAGNEATIESLSKEVQGEAVSCVHVEMISRGKEHEDWPVVDRRDIKIDVWYKPEFNEESSIQYAIIDDNERDATIYCNVSDSNPPPKHFTFFVDDHEVTDDEDERYELVRDVGRGYGAYLKIHDVKQADLQQYRCEVSNGKAKASHIINLRAANPPFEPKVTLHEAKKHSIVWKIEGGEDDEGPMPVTAIEIFYVRKAVVHDRLGSEEDIDIDDGFWKSHGGRVLREKTKNNLYEVKGLREATDYVFKFRQISDVGFGDSIVLTASTYDENSDSVDSAPGFIKSMSFWTTIILFSLIQIF